MHASNEIKQRSAQTVAEFASHFVNKLQRQNIEITDELGDVFTTSIHDKDDLEKIIKYLITKNKVSIFLYETSMERRGDLSNDILRPIYNYLEKQRLDLEGIGKGLDNRDLPRYQKLQELLGIKYLH